MTPLLVGFSIACRLRRGSAAAALGFGCLAAALAPAAAPTPAPTQTPTQTPTQAASAPPAIEIREWVVPWKASRPRDPYPGADGTVWFVGQRGDYVGRLDPESGRFQRIDLEAGTGPHTVIANDRGVWYAGNRRHHIGRIDPESGSIERLEVPGEGRRDPHTMAFTSRGDIWFTMQHGNRIGFLAVASGRMRSFELPTPGARPYGLVVDEGDRPWFTLFGTHALGTIDADGGLREIPLPREEARPRRLAVDGDGRVWYVDFAHGYLGVFDPADASVREWRVPGGDRAGPYAMGVDADDRPWLVETGREPNRFVGFDPGQEDFTEPVAVPSGGGTVRHMVWDDAAGGFWFGSDANTVGLARPRPAAR